MAKILRDGGLPGEPSGRLAVKHTVRVVWVACVIGLVICLIEIAWIGWHERAKVQSQITDLLNLAEGSATIAAWYYDQSLAERVLEGMLVIPAVRDAGLSRPDGEAIAVRNRPRRPREGAYGRIADALFLDVATGRRVLRGIGATSNGTLGTLSITIDTTVAANNLWEIIKTSMIGGLIRNFLLGCVLAWVFHRSLTRPLVRIGQAMALVDPERPIALPVPVPPKHADDELGQMVVCINRTLARLDWAQCALRDLATRDPLTGLANRATVHHRLGQGLGRAARFGHIIAVLYLDIDRFKLVNDSLGHESGDQFLRALAARLAMMIRDLDTIGRLGGDEFIILAEQLRDPDEAAMIAYRLLAAVAEPLVVQGHRLQLTASIGIAVYPTDGDEPSTLIEHADVAMDAAKAAGSNRFTFYTHSLTERAMGRLRVEADLREALDRAEFELHYQPLIHLATHSVCGCEALVRWRRNGRLVPPLEFIGIAEDTGLIVPIGDWVIDAACSAIGKWRRLAPIRVGVNVSARHLAERSFPDQVAGALSRHHVPPEALEIEITESVLMQDMAIGRERLAQLRAIGVRIAIDDFGTGYSSLAYLRHLPVHSLKIDRTFVGDLPHEPRIVSAVIMLARCLNLETVAEGVETEAQRAWLAEAGCTTIQGFLISPAIPADQFMARHLNTVVAAPGMVGLP